MKKSLLLAITGALALAMAFGCNKKSDEAPSKDAPKAGAMTPEPGGGSGPSAEEQGDRMLAGKLQPYIKMTNYLSKRVYDGRRRYFQWVKKPKKGPTCKERFIYGVYTLPAVESYAKAVEKVQQSEPRLKALEAGAAKYIEALGKLVPLLKKARRYYEQKDYKDDKCKVGIELHPQLMKWWAQFMAADRAVGAEIEKINLDLHYRLLARIAKKFGKTSPRYYHKKLTLDAGVLLHVLARNSRPKTKPDNDKIAAAVKKYDALVLEMEEKTGKGKQPTGYSWFRSAANDYVKACKEMMRRLKSGKKWSKSEKRRLAGSTAYWVAGSYPKVLKKFNELIGKANGVRFR